MITKYVTSLPLHVIGLVAMAGCYSKPRSAPPLASQENLANPPAAKHRGQVVRILNTHTPNPNDTVAFAEIVIDKKATIVTAHFMDETGKPFDVPAKKIAFTIFHTIQTLPEGIKRNGYTITLLAQQPKQGRASTFTGKPNPDFVKASTGFRRLLDENQPLQCALDFGVTGDDFDMGSVYFTLTNPLPDKGEENGKAN